MCRNIKQLRGIEPEALEGASIAAALQYVRKVSGFARPSRANQEAFDRATEEIAAITRRLLGELVVRTPTPRGERRA